jgi:hypothetical protein
LPRFAVVGLSAEARGTHGTSSGADGWVYQDGQGRLLQIEVAPAEVVSVAWEQRRVVSNIVFPFARAVHGDDPGAFQSEVERVTNAIRSGGLEWEDGSILIDDQVTAVEVLDIGNNFWIAVAHLPDCVLSVSSHGVPRDHLALTRIG